MRRAVDEARAVGGQVVVLTFHPHPVAVLAPDEGAPAAAVAARSADAACATSASDVVVLQRFTPRFAALDPEAFIRDFLGAHLELLHVVVGHNVSFGRGARGHGGDAARARARATGSPSTRSVR